MVAVVLSNLPEAIAATTGLRQSGWRSLRIVELWGGVVLVSGLAAPAGYAFLDGALAERGRIRPRVRGRRDPDHARRHDDAGGFQHGGRLTGVFTTLGFATFAVSAFE